MMNVVCLCVLSLVLVATANLALPELNILVCPVSSGQPVDHSGGHCVTSPSLVRSLRATCISPTSLHRESGTVLLKAGSLGAVFIFALLYLLLQEA